MAPTQPFKPRALRIPNQSKERSKSRHDLQNPPERRLERGPSHSKSRGDDKKTKRDRRYELVKKLDVCMDVGAASGSDDEYGSDLDVDKPMYSIGEYLGDRKALVGEMFKSLKRSTLQKLIPPILRDFSLKELGTYVTLINKNSVHDCLLWDITSSSV